MHVGKLVLAASACVYNFLLDCARAVCFYFMLDVCMCGLSLSVCMHVVHVRMYFLMYVYMMLSCAFITHGRRRTGRSIALAPRARETCYLDMDRSMVTRARAHLRGNALRCCRIHYPFCSSSSPLEDPHLNAPCKRGEGRGKVHAYYSPG